ncbi:MAG: hypothetical protein GF388_09990 [Candidatus Aegiribacteria sp.]|nr:hypothetical protein [Candidatus Aegiribacteria sp.]MBD3295363.1 hypothetical protein [Candidatus Fermentibacteria bacterium]
MHDGLYRWSTTGLLFCLTGVILLGSIPAIFREPSTTFYGTVDIALHAYQLSMAASVSPGDVPFSFPGAGELSDGLLFGSHDFFPYRINTCRDPRSEVILARIAGDVDNFRSGPVENRSGLTATALKTENGLYILFGESAESWPQRLFSHLSEDG